MSVGLIGNGYLGKAYAKVFPDAFIYDPYALGDKSASKEDINACDIALVMVPTDPLPDGSLDMSIVEEVVGWLETPLILIKSALMPGTVDRLVEKTGKRIAISVEYIGMGSYYLDPHDYPDPLDPQKHKLLVVGGEVGTAQACAEVLWSKMSPDTRIHLVSAKEAEICKLIENAYGALKVTFANCFRSLVDASGESFIRTHQAWSEDGRTDPMHTRVVAGKRGWKSHCYDKDIQALQSYSSQVGATDMAELYETVIKLNKGHLELN
jgi:UDPglucose 6-dehydrogenase